MFTVYALKKGACWKDCKGAFFWQDYIDVMGPKLNKKGVQALDEALKHFAEFSKKDFYDTSCDHKGNVQKDNTLLTQGDGPSLSTTGRFVFAPIVPQKDEKEENGFAILIGYVPNHSSGPGRSDYTKKMEEAKKIRNRIKAECDKRKQDIKTKGWNKVIEEILAEEDCISSSDFRSELQGIKEQTKDIDPPAKELKQFIDKLSDMRKEVCANNPLASAQEIYELFKYEYTQKIGGVELGKFARKEWHMITNGNILTDKVIEAINVFCKNSDRTNKNLICDIRNINDAMKRGGR